MWEHCSNQSQFLASPKKMCTQKSPSPKYRTKWHLPHRFKAGVGASSSSWPFDTARTFAMNCSSVVDWKRISLNNQLNLKIMFLFIYKIPIESDTLLENSWNNDRRPLRVPTLPRTVLLHRCLKAISSPKNSRKKPPTYVLIFSEFYGYNLCASILHTRVCVWWPAGHTGLYSLGRHYLCVPTSHHCYYTRTLNRSYTLAVPRLANFYIYFEVNKIAFWNLRDVAIFELEFSVNKCNLRSAVDICWGIEYEMCAIFVNYFKWETNNRRVVLVDAGRCVATEGLNLATNRKI